MMHWVLFTMLAFNIFIGFALMGMISVIYVRSNDDEQSE